MNKLLIQLLILDRTNKQKNLISNLEDSHLEISKSRITRLIQQGIFTRKEMKRVFSEKTIDYKDFMRFFEKLNKKQDVIEQEHQENVEAAKLSMTTYQSSQATIKKTMSTLGFSNTQVIELIPNKDNTENNLKAVLSEKNNELYVIFRGSTTVHNWLTNLHFANPSDIFSTQVEKRFHRGFKNYTDTLKPHLDKYISTYGKNKKLNYIGHSLGGALALSYSLYRKPNKIITFGAPRVSSAEQYTNYFDQIDKRKFANYSDVIRMLPFKFLGFDNLLETTILDSKFNMFSVINNHTIPKYSNQIIERAITGSGFTEHCLAGILNTDNFDLIKETCEEDFLEVENKIREIQFAQGKTYNESVKSLFKKSFNISEEEFLEYEDAIDNTNRMPEIAFRVMQGFNKKHLSKTINNFYHHLRLHESFRKYRETPAESFFEKNVFFFSAIGTAITSFLRTGNLEMFKSAINVAFRTHEKKESINDFLDDKPKTNNRIKSTKTRKI